MDPQSTNQGEDAPGANVVEESSAGKLPASEHASVDRIADPVAERGTDSDQKLLSAGHAECALENPPPGRGEISPEGFAFALENLPTDKIPDFVKQHEHYLTFPEKLMLMLTFAERMGAKEGTRSASDSIGWTLNGTAFALRDRDHLTSTWLPLFFGKAKFSSFTRKLYRWEFRKLNPGASSPDHDNNSAPGRLETIFANENFQKDNPRLLSNMRSVTAVKTRGEVQTLAVTRGQVAFPGGDILNNQMLQLVHGDKAATRIVGQQQQRASMQRLFPQLQNQMGVERMVSAALAQSASASFVNAWGESLPFSSGSWQHPLTVGLEQPQPPQDSISSQYLLHALAGLPFIPASGHVPQRPPSGIFSSTGQQHPSPQHGLGSTQDTMPNTHSQQQQQNEQTDQEWEQRGAVADLLSRLGPRPPSPR